MLTFSVYLAFFANYADGIAFSCLRNASNSVRMSATTQRAHSLIGTCIMGAGG